MAAPITWIGFGRIGFHHFVRLLIIFSYEQWNKIIIASARFYSLFLFPRLKNLNLKKLNINTSFFSLSRLL